MIMEWRLCWHHTVTEMRGIDISNDRGARLALALASASEVMEDGSVWQWQGGGDGGDVGRQRVPVVRWQRWRCGGYHGWRWLRLLRLQLLASALIGFGFG